MSIGGLKKPLAVRLVTALTAVILGVLAGAGQAGADTTGTGRAGAARTGVVSPAASRTGGPISRSEVIQRAADWMRKKPAYCANSKANCAAQGTPWAWDLGHTREYRPDCSGLVDMAWHLAADPNTDGLATSGFTTPIATKDLKPGDLLDDLGDGHAVLFDRWADGSHTKLYYYAETHPGSSMEHTTGSLNSTIAGWPAGHYKAYRYKKIQGGGDEPPTKKDTKLAYTGPGFVANGSAATLSATLTDKDGKAVASREVGFTLGSGGSAQTCKDTTGADGKASCVIAKVAQTGRSATVTVRFDGDDTYAASSTTATVKLKKDTKLAYTGPASVENGSAAKLAAKLTDTDGTAVGARPVRLALGSGASAQSCTGTTDTAGEASCTVGSVEQPLTDDATVPIAVTFDGDDAYNASKASATVRLAYVTGRSFGMSADVPLLGLPITIKPTPDTGRVRTAEATTTEPSCARNVSALLLSAGTLCGKVTTRTGPMSATSTASVAKASIGLAGLPVIGLSGVTSTATGTCTASSGGTHLTLTVAGTLVDVGDTPNLDVDLGVLGTKLVVNEQVRNADGGLTVNAAHLTGPGGIDIVIASSTAAAHNCA